jgi:uncharacterized protein
MLELFPKNEVIGVFRGFQEGGMEFHADLSLPYRPKLHNVPMHGQFLVVQLENPDEAVLGRITSLSAEGRLAGAAGEEYSIRAASEGRKISDDLRQDYLRYRVNIRVLGVVRIDNGAITFAPSHRRLPHVGSPVAFLSSEVQRHLLGHYGEGADLGFFALGEYIYAGEDPRLEAEPWVQVQPLSVKIKFPVKHLVSRRTLVFARAGYGKSNLNKLLFSMLYSSTPTVKKSGDKEVPVGTVIFDPDGEYFWPDDKGNPGLCDVPELKNQVVVFTSRQGPSPFYQSFVAGGIKLDIRRLQPSDVVSIALSPEKQEQQNVRKLRGMNLGDWATLVDLIHRDGNGADLDHVQQLLRLESDQQFEALAARANMTAIVRMLHNPSSMLMDMLMKALSEGKLCIIDVSQLRGQASLILSGLILRRIFDHNQHEFTNSNPKTIPTIAVVEEAQSVLNDRGAASGPYIEWVKEGRKYDLGALLITQQPGSIPTEILSQGDNWFIFHLLSAVDLQNLRKANAHFSEDILSSLLNEPIKGQGVFWSGVSDMPFPIPLRTLSFSRLYGRADASYSKPEMDTYATQLRNEVTNLVLTLASEVNAPEGEANLKSQGVTYEINPGSDSIVSDIGNGMDSIDPYRLQQKRAIQALRKKDELWKGLDKEGIPWGVVTGMLRDELPETMDDKDKIAFSLVAEAMDQLIGPKGVAWTTARKGKKNTTFIVRMRQSVS